MPTFPLSRPFLSLAVAAALVTVLPGCSSASRPDAGASITGPRAHASTAAPAAADSSAPAPSAETLAEPSCSRPNTVNADWPLARPAAVLTGGQALQAGTDHSAAAAAWAYPAAQVRQWITHPTVGQPRQKIAFITFDDGPTSTITPRELDNLKAAGVHATFFQIGYQIGSVSPALEARIIAEGNAIGVHSYSHDYDFLYPHRVADAAHIACDFQWGRYAIARSLGTGYNGDVSRYPGGHLSWKAMAPADAALAGLGDTWIDWNAMSGDAEPAKTRPRTVPAVIRYLDRQVAKTKGQVLVILNHDAADKELTARAMPAIIADLKQRGYTFGIIA